MVRGRPTLKDAEQFRTGSIIHESKDTFGYVKTCINNCQNTQKVAKNIIQKVNENVTNNTPTKQSSCCTVNEHMVNMAASRKATKNIDNAISSEQTTIKNFSTLNG